MSSEPGSAAGAHLALLVDHHCWATLRLLEVCAALSPEQLGLTLPGTFGSIHQTLEHLVRSDGGYQRRMLGGARAEPPPELPSLAALRAHMERNAAGWRDVLPRLDGLDVTHPAETGEEPYPEVRHAERLYLAQALHHGAEHRTHVLSILGAHGLDPPELSGWEYVRERPAGG